MVISAIEVSDVLICEDHPFVQVGLEVLLRDSLPGLQSLRKFTRGRDAIQAASEKKPDLAFVDLGLPDVSGVEVIQGLLRLWSDLQIVVVTNCDNKSTLNQVRNLGVAAIVQKLSSPDQLEHILDSIFSTENRTTALDTATTEILRRENGIEFTPREYDVLQEIILGKSNQQIAGKLGCAVTTVRFHRANILEKTGIRNAAELTAWFLQGQHKDR